MIPPILILVICVALLTIYVSVQAGFRSAFDRHIRRILVCLAVHALYAWVMYVYFSEQGGARCFMPFCLLYGPLLYFTDQLSQEKPLKTGIVILHVLPFMIFLMGDVFTRAFSWHISIFVGSSRWESYGICALSLSIYAVWALFFKQQNAVHRRDTLRIFSSLAMLVAFCAVTFSVATYSTLFLGQEETKFVEFIAFLDMLGATLLLFSYTVEQVFATLTPPLISPDAPPHEESEEVAAYQKSAIAADLLAAYESLLRQVVEEEQAYLDDQLSSASLARQLKISKHHLSQVFSQRIGKNFNTYINECRVNHATVLMSAHPEWPIAEIFTASGFAAKASFNRYFKQFKGCTPTEYRNTIKQ